jgi:hypothetical protein
MHYSRLFSLGLACALVLAAAGVAVAQTTGTIAGQIVDSQGLVVPGATVTVTGAQGVKTAITDREGRFSVPFLVPGSYTVRVDLTGFKSVEQKNVIVRLGFTAELNLTMQVGGVEETVNVAATSPVVDTSSTTIGATLDNQLLERVPIGRRFSDTLYMAPGVSTGGTIGSANPSVSGASGLENAYVVDGVNITNAGYGALGSYSIVFGSLGNGTPYDFMQEVQVKSGGYEAEYGQSTGGVVNVITKSGSNNFQGSLFGYSRPRQLESAWTNIQTPNGSVNTTGTQLNDVGAAIGGPVVHNKLFFFGAVDPSFETRTMIAPTNDPASFPLSALGEVNRDRRVYSYAAKATWQLSTSHRIDASFFGDPAVGLNGPQRSTALLAQDTSRYSKLDRYGGNNQTVKYDGIMRSNWLLEAAFASAINDVREVPSVNAWAVTDNTVEPHIVSGGIGGYEAGNHGRSLQYLAKSTHIFANHQIRYGVEVDKVNYDQINQRTGPTFTLVTGEQTATGASIQIVSDPVYGKVYHVVRANLNAQRSTDQLYSAFFAEDTWRVGNRLTIKPGIRYERERMDGTITKNFVLGNNWAPRVGATYALTGDTKTKVYGSFGMFFARTPNDLAARALSADAGIAADYFDAGLTQPIPDGVLAAGRTVHYSIAGAGADVIDPNVKQMYMREYLAGVERELFPNLNVGVRYVHRSIPRVLEDVQTFPVVAADLGIPGADSVDYILTNPGPNTPVSGDLGASFETPVHKYDAVEVTVDKRFSRNWGVQASYRWSRLFGTYEGFYRDDNGQSDPGITSLYDFPTNDPSYTAIGVPEFGYRGDIRYLGNLGAGPLPLDRPHQAKFFGNYSFNFGLNIGAGVNLSSGKPLTPLASNPNLNYQNGGEIPEAPRGSGIQTVDGFKTRTPFQSEFSAHADYSLKLGGKQRLIFLMDVFNLFDQKTVLDYDTWTETTTGVLNPNFGLPVTSALGGNPPQIQTPRQFRIGVRFTFG